MTDIELFEKLGAQHQNLDGKIDARTPEMFIAQFRSIFSCAIAKKSRGVVYIWSTKLGIPRMKGKSNVIYVGKTNSSLYKRHYRYAGLEGSGYNWERYKFIIEMYGAIKVRCALTNKPREVEKKMLELYFSMHLEYPPVNSNG